MGSPPPDYKHLAKSIFLRAVEAVHPYALIRKNVTASDKLLTIAGETFSLEDIRHIYIIGAGKATATMARAIEDILGSQISGGVILVKYAHTEPLTHITTIEAAHPVPDENGLSGTRQLMELVAGAGEHDLVIALLSGGGSALLIDLPPGCSLPQLQECFELLLRSGASIEEINALRKHVSGVKGGQLAKAVYPARLISLVLSDVIGDPLDVIASGPTVPDPTTFADAWAILEKYHLVHHVSSGIRLHLQQGLSGIIADTPKPADPVFASTSTYIIGSNAIALQAAKQQAEMLGIFAMVCGENISGEAEEAARWLVAQARHVASDTRIPKPACILAGGETTVTVTGKGKGGRNQHLALAAALKLTPDDKVIILSAGTDGTDGPTDAAGAIVDGYTVAWAAKQGINATDYLLDHNSYPFFRQTSSHIITGPTLTNVMDILMALVY